MENDSVDYDIKSGVKSINEFIKIVKMKGCEEKTEIWANLNPHSYSNNNKYILT